MLIKRQFRGQQQQQKSNSIFSNQIDSWKVRSINGFEKYLFPNIQISTQSIPKHRLKTKIDPARFIYPRDAMGDMLHRRTSAITPFYLPKYDFIKTRSPVWTIKNIYNFKRAIHHVGPMTYDSVNDKSQLPCKFGWTQTGRRAFPIQLGLTVPFYDTRKYKEVGDSCSKHAVIIGQRASRRKRPNVIKGKAIEEIIVKSNDRVETVELSVSESIMKTEQETTVVRDDKTLANDQHVQLKILPSEEFETETDFPTDGAINN